MASKEDDDKLLKELKEALKEDPPDLKSMKESAKALREKLQNGKKS
jgi:hypothetical protein